MDHHKIAVVINYCTNDYRFIGASVREAAKFAFQIIVPVCDHFFDGSPENENLFEKTIKENPEAKFIKFSYEEKAPPFPGHWFWKLVPRSYGLRPFYGDPYLICKARFLGCQSVSVDADYILFLDADEIVDGDEFKRWLAEGKYVNFDAVNFLCYWYFRDPKYQATTFEKCGLLIKRNAVKEKSFFSYKERWQLFDKTRGKKKRGAVGLDRLPMIHHYGWARNNEEMLKKVATWGHRDERDWTKLVEEEFSHDFRGRDFLRNYSYKTVRPSFNLGD